jgi:hypothetical protein
MAKTASKKTASRSRAGKPARRKPMPREVRAAVSEMRKGVAHLDSSIADLRSGLMRAERTIEADARRRIRALRAEGRTQLKELQGKQREVGHLLKRLSVAAGESWRDLKRGGDTMLADARRTAAAVGKRFRLAMQR